MARFQNILVGLDLHHGDRLTSDSLEAASDAALRQAVEIAELQGAKLTLCACLDISEQAHHLIEVDTQNLNQTVEDYAAAELEKLAGTLQARGLYVDKKIYFGKPSEQLARQAIRGEHDLVIVGNRKRNSAARALFGSTCHKLLRICPVPVWVVKPEELREVREVLVASDFSDVASSALHAGVAVAKALKAKLYLVHALEFAFESYLQTAGVSETEVKAYRKKLHEEAMANLQEQLAQTDYRTVEQGVKVEIVEGTPDAVIPQFIDDKEIDVLVIGTHGRSGFSGLLLGNTAERVLPHAHCSVLAVKPKDFVSPVKP
ncbi:hypothetical protein GC163_03350 [bacterium]|nr:hypothetical protein [bacterium]